MKFNPYLTPEKKNQFTCNNRKQKGYASATTHASCELICQCYRGSTARCNTIFSNKKHRAGLEFDNNFIGRKFYSQVRKSLEKVCMDMYGCSWNFLNHLSFIVTKQLLLSQWPGLQLGAQTVFELKLKRNILHFGLFCSFLVPLQNAWAGCALIFLLLGVWVSFPGFSTPAKGENNRWDGVGDFLVSFSGV